MPRRPSRAPLYDLMSTRRGTTVESAPVVDVDDGDDVGSSWLSPGRVVRLPVGYIFLALGFVALVIAAAFVLGHARGESAARARFEREFTAAPGPGASLRDPLRGPEAGAPVVAPNTPGATRTDADIAPPAAVDPRGWGRIDADRRVAGRAYFVLAETTPGGAGRLAEFCRAEGLETYVIAGENASLRRVVAFPGFDPDERASEAAQALRARIHAIGDRWKRAEPGASDLRDAYPSTYSGT